MKNFFRYSFILVVLVSVLASCSVSNFSVEKRRYRKGFYVGASEYRKGEKITAGTIEAEKTVAVIDNKAGAAELNPASVSEQSNIAAPGKGSYTVTPAAFVAEKLESQAAHSRSFSVAERIQVKALSKAIKKESQKSPFDEPDQVVLVILAFLIPPLAVYLHEDDANDKFWINVILTLLCGLPGVIHALYIVLKD